MNPQNSEMPSRFARLNEPRGPVEPRPGAFAVTPGRRDDATVRPRSKPGQRSTPPNPR